MKHLKPLLIAVALFVAALPLAANEKRVVAVTSFKNLTGDTSLTYLGEVFSELLITDLLSTKRVSIVERARLQELIKEIELHRTGLIDPEKAAELGKMTGAEYLILGNYLSVGGTITVTARISKVSTGEVLAAEKIGGVTTDNVIETSETLARAIVKHLSTSLPDVVTPRPTSVPDVNALSFSYTPSNPHYYDVQKNSNAYVLVELKGRKQEERNERPSLNVALVMDVSGSMANERKLDYAKKAAKFVVSQLNENDYLSIVTYSSEVATVFSPARVKDKEEAYRVIDEMQASGSTYLSGGLARGAKCVKEAQAGACVPRVILLTDGLANRGVTSREGLTQMAAREFKQGVAISSFGLGLRYDEDLMLDIAEFGGGRYWYIKTAEDIPSLFHAEMKGLSRVVANNVRLTITLDNDVRFVRAFGYNAEENNHAVTLTPNTILAEETKRILLKLDISHVRKKQQRLVAVTVSYTDTKTSDTQKEEGIPLTLVRAPSLSVFEGAYDPFVMDHVNLHESVEFFKDAIERVDNCDFAGAERNLDESILALQQNAIGAPASDKVKKQMVRMIKYKNELDEAMKRAEAEGMSMEEALDNDEMRGMQKDNKYFNYEQQQ